MATPISSITRLLRAAVSHRTTTTTLLRPHHHNLHRNHHTFTTTSPLTFLHSHPFNHRISKPYFFSTSRRVNPRATKSKHSRFCGMLIEGTFNLIIDILMFGGCIYMFAKYTSKFMESLDEEMGTKFKGSLPDFVRKGHTVVVEGYIKPVKGYNFAGYYFEYYCSATEVSSNPEQIVAAMDRNSYIIAEKQNVANQKQNAAVEEQKLNVAAEEEKQNVSVEEREVLINWCTSTTPSDEITNDVANPSITLSFHDALVLEGRVNQSVVFSLIAKMQIDRLLREALYEFEGLPDALREGHSVLVERSVKAIRHGIKEVDKSGKSVAVKVCGSEYHISAEVLAKHDKKCMPQDAAAIDKKIITE